jgi:hypothetical protein
MATTQIDGARRPRQMRRRWWLALVAIAMAMVLAFGAVWTNALGMGERFERYMARVQAIIDPPPDRATLPTVVVTPRPSESPSAAAAEPRAPMDGPEQAARPIPVTPTPAPVRAPVDVTIVADHAAVFNSQNTSEDCAPAGTQMVLALLGLADTSDAFQEELKSRIGEWESWDDSHDGGWGPAAVSLALAAYGAPGYEIRAYESHLDALRGIAGAIAATGKPVVLFPWWGAHTWVVTGYGADADPAYFPDANVSGLYILDPWYPRVSSIWGPSDPPGNFEDLAEMERNFPYGTNLDGWHRPEGAYPDRDGKYVVLVPTIPLADAS